MSACGHDWKIFFWTQVARSTPKRLLHPTAATPHESKGFAHHPCPAALQLSICPAVGLMICNNWTESSELGLWLDMGIRRGILLVFPLQAGPCSAWWHLGRCGLVAHALLQPADGWCFCKIRCFQPQDLFLEFSFYHDLGCFCKLSRVRSKWASQTLIDKSLEKYNCRKLLAYSLENPKQLDWETDGSHPSSNPKQPLNKDTVRRRGAWKRTSSGTHKSWQVVAPPCDRSWAMGRGTLSHPWQPQALGLSNLVASLQDGKTMKEMKQCKIWPCMNSAMRGDTTLPFFTLFCLHCLVYSDHQ